MQKRAQVTVFIILGLVVMVVAGLFLLNSQKQALPSRSASGQEFASVNAEGLAIQGLVNSCLKQKFLEGKSYFGLESGVEPELKAYIEATLPQCADFTGFTSKGLKVQAGKPAASVTITEQAAAAEVQYPITVFSGQAKAELQSFSYYFRTESRVMLKQGADGRTSTDAVKAASDGVAELRIPTGALVTKDGQALGEVSIKVVDRNFENIENSVVLGEVVYEGLPEGAEFEPPIEITIRYDDEDLPPGITEESLAIAYYNREKDLWISLPDSYVDAENNKVTARVSHFSLFAIAIGCGKDGKKDIIKQTTYLGFIYQAPCYSTEPGGICPQWVIKKKKENEQDSDVFLRSRDAVRGGGVEHKPDDGPIYATPEQEARIGVYNEFTLKSKGECELKHWQHWDASEDHDDDSEKTHGYEQVGDAGSKKSEATFTFTLEPSGDSCTLEKTATIKLSCDDECTDFTLNSKKIDVENVLRDGRDENEYTITIPVNELAKAGKENTVAFTVNNLYEMCSSASGELTLHGTGFFENCPESKSEEDYLIKGCKCGNRNINILYDKEKIGQPQEPAFRGALNKGQAELAKDGKAKSLLKGAVAEGKEQYCYKGSVVVGSKEFQKIKSAGQAYKESFKRAAATALSKEIAACCEDAEIYPDTSSENGKEGCEIIVCKKKGERVWAYTGNELKDGVQNENPACEGAGGNTKEFLAKACGKAKRQDKRCRDKPDGEYCSAPDETNEMHYCIDGQEMGREEYAEQLNRDGVPECGSDRKCVGDDNGKFAKCEPKVPRAQKFGECKKAVTICSNDNKQLITCTSAGAGTAKSCPDKQTCPTGKNACEHMCGNNRIDDEEECDGTQLNGKSCAHFSYLKGVPKCKKDCGGFDVTSCSEKCEPGKMAFMWSDKTKEGCSQLSGAPRLDERKSPILLGNGNVCCEKKPEAENKCTITVDGKGKFYNEGDEICDRFPDKLSYGVKKCALLQTPDAKYHGWSTMPSLQCEFSGNEKENKRCACDISYKDAGSAATCVQSGKRETITGVPKAELGDCKKFCDNKLKELEQNIAVTCDLELAAVRFYP